MKEIGRKIYLISSIIIIVFVITGCATPTPRAPSASQEQEEQNKVKEVEKTGIERPGQQTTVPKVEEEKTYLVTRVIDGDTIEIEGGQKIRYIGIDTPETVDPRKPVQCFGTEANNRNKQLVEGKRVRLEKDVSEVDKYGRLLRYVYVDDIFVNLVLVQEGFAYSYTYPPDVKYQNQFIEAERIAREQNNGLWGSCPVSTPTPTPTQTQTITSPTPLTQSPANCTIKGNISSSGEKIYHVIGCGSYNVTKIDEARGERWFCAEEEAVAAGWRKAKNCP